MAIKKGSHYQHFKGGVVEVICLAKHSETLEDMIIYIHDDTYWARPLSSFLSPEDVRDRPDNVTGQKYRFELLKEE